MQWTIAREDERLALTDSGLLRWLSEDCFMFAHRIFMEYAAALHAVSIAESSEQLKELLQQKLKVGEGLEAQRMFVVFLVALLNDNRDTIRQDVLVDVVLKAFAKQKAKVLLANAMLMSGEERRELLREGRTFLKDMAAHAASPRCRR